MDADDRHPETRTTAGNEQVDGPAEVARTSASASASASPGVRGSVFAADPRRMDDLPRLIAAAEAAADKALGVHQRARAEIERATTLCTTARMLLQQLRDRLPKGI